METIFDLQRSMYAGAIEALRGLHAAGAAGLPALVVAAFGFGMLHALLPGHGKSVLASYYAGEGRWRGALGSTTILIVTHVGSAIVLVLTGFIVLQQTIGGAGRAPLLEQASRVLIGLIGLWLLWRALRPHAHRLDRSGPVLAVATGMVPCPLTTFIMTYAAAHGVILAGLVLSGMFAAGMIVTVAAFPLLAVVLRARLLPAMVRTEAWRERVGGLLEVASALAVTAFGWWPLLQATWRPAG
jgi:ABC-type nickel/cobalt efflux system permease component RcnA